jgi:hypothetical protein
VQHACLAQKQNPCNQHYFLLETLRPLFESTDAHLFVAAFSANQHQIQKKTQNFSAPFQTFVSLETKSIKNIIAGEYSIADVLMDRKMHHIALQRSAHQEIEILFFSFSNTYFAAT